MCDKPKLKNADSDSQYTTPTVAEGDTLKPTTLTSCTPTATSVNTAASISNPGRYVDRLRNEDLDKLSQFIKLHISFLMDIANDETFQKMMGEKQECKQKRNGNILGKRRKSLGSSSDLIGEVQLLDEQLSAVMQLIAFLQNSPNLWVEGIFRLAGGPTRQNELEIALKQELDVDFKLGRYSAHDCATVLKRILSSLPEPLLHEKLLNAYLYTLEIENVDRRKKITCLLLQMMSSSNFAIAKLLFKLLHKVSKNESRNRMNADSLGIIFANCLLCPKKISVTALKGITEKAQLVISFIITHTPELFRVPQLLALDVVNHLRKTNASFSSADSPISVASISSNNSKGSSTMSAGKKHKLPLPSEPEEDEPMETIVKFATTSCSQDSTMSKTELELAKLHAHVQTMCDSPARELFMKRIAESKKNSEKKRVRSQSFGRNLIRRLSGRKRQKSVNIDIGSNSAPGLDSSSVIANQYTRIPNTHTKPVIRSKLQPSLKPFNPDSKMEIGSYTESPYPLRRTTLRTQLLRSSGVGQTSVSSQSTGSENKKTCSLNLNENGEMHSYASTHLCENVVSDNSVSGLPSPSTPQHAPPLRKPLLPTNVASTPESQQLIFRKAKDHIATPPRPNRPMVLVDEGIAV